MKSHGTILITGSLGLLGSACVRLFVPHAETIVGIDNDSRGTFFGAEGSTSKSGSTFPANYRHENIDIRDRDAIGRIFQRSGTITAVIHCAAQPAHDWAGANPVEDFEINAAATLYVLDAARKHAPAAPFIFASSSKVYGDRVNELPLRVSGDRFTVDPANPHARGILESLPVDASMHSPYGCGKYAADLYVQEYGRYYGMRTACFRPGTITGPDHAAVELHGFIAYLVKCCSTGRPYTVNGYGGYQVRDVVHADDLARAFAAVVDSPPLPGQPLVTNFGGGLHSNCSMLEAIRMAEEACKRRMRWTYSPVARRGDHMWYVGSCKTFMDRHGSVRGWQEVTDAQIKTWPGTLPAKRLAFDPDGFSYSYTLPRIVADIADRYITEAKVSA